MARKRFNHPPKQAFPPPAGIFFYRPENAWAGDFIPLYAEGKFQLFYLLAWRDDENHGEGTPWYRVSTTDFVNYEEHGEMIPRGSKDDQDLFIFTGSAIKAKDGYHIFYTGHNHHMAEKDKPMQAVMHAVSDDLKHWKKIPEHTFFAPTDRYEKNDWRDPFVFFNEETKEYNMLLAAKYNKGIPRRRGITALCTSKDLVKWEVEDAFYAPSLYITHECPDLFKIGDWWYLVFSEYSDLVATRYRMSRSLKGPWLTPKRDSFDGHAFYAAKTASDGKNRFIFGWNPTRSDEKDDGGWNWGGNLVVHQIIQQPNGELAVRVPDTVRKAFGKTISPVIQNGRGQKHSEQQRDRNKGGG
jgi:beta-fructofuranosidase